jgi:hypothetical protein
MPGSYVSGRIIESILLEKIRMLFNVLTKMCQDDSSVPEQVYPEIILPD